MLRWFLVRVLGLSERMGWICLDEVQRVLCRWRTKVSLQQIAARKDLAERTGLRVNLGAGGTSHPDWLGIDLSAPPGGLAWDLGRDGIPLRDGSCRHLFSEHCFEHLHPEYEIPFVLGECYRVLQPGGVLRVLVPDGGRYCRAYAEGDGVFFRHVGAEGETPMEAVNGAARGAYGGHLFLYDFETLAKYLRAAGFETVASPPFGASDHPGLAIDGTHRAARSVESLVVEAVKPGESDQGDNTSA